MKKVFVSDTTLADFTPTLTWPQQYESKKYGTTVRDGVTGYLFLNEPRNVIRIKFCALTVLTPVLHGFIALYLILNLFIKFFYDLFKLILGGRDNISKNAINILQDILNIVIAPSLVIALELTAIIGIIFPLNARKIFGSIERFIINYFECDKVYNKENRQKSHTPFSGDKGIWAPCFQPKVEVKEETSINNNQA